MLNKINVMNGKKKLKCSGIENIRFDVDFIAIENAIFSRSSSYQENGDKWS